MGTVDLSRYDLLIQAVEAERKNEEQLYLDVLKNKSVKEKVNLGFAWHPAKLISSQYSIGENIEVELERMYDLDKAHKLNEGAGVMLTSNKFKEDLTFTGTISFVRKNKIKILLRGDAITKQDLPDNHYFTIELVYDERPYALMTKAIQEVVELKNGPIKLIRDGMATLKSLDETNGNEPCLPHHHLNDSQKHAIAQCLKANQFSIIHGPPGTGKTTTLVTLIAELVKQESKVLVCASSNNAVDLLSGLLDLIGLNVLRIGNITRIGDEIANLTLDEKVRSHAEWSRIKKIKIEAEEAKKMARQYKRTFGQEQKDDRKSMMIEAKELRQWAKTLEEKIVDEVIASSQVILATMIGSASSVIEGIKFKTLVIDEASQVLEPEFWVAMLKAEKVILAGDHLQLPPTVKSKEAMRLGLNTTVLDRMEDVCRYSSLLNIQYRMNNSILHFPNHQFYEGKLTSDITVANRLLRNDTKPVIYIDTAGTGFEEKFNKEYLSYYNDGEYFVIREHILANKEILVGHTIGIITPYREQAKYITLQLNDDDTLRPFVDNIDTVDGFQGQEKDVIYLSLVRSNDKGEIGFLADERRLNVALTRAQKKIVIVGDSSTIGKNEIYNSLLGHIEKNESYQSAWEYMSY